MNGAQLVTKALMVEDAYRAGFGEPRILAKTFTNYQQFGLLGGYVEKAKRRGGEGLWHPAQQTLWLQVLRNRAAGVSIARCTSIPVAYWLFGIPGVCLDQAQKAWGTWSSSRLDFSDRRAKIRQQVDEQVVLIASERASASQRRALRDSLDHFLDGIIPTQDTFRAAFLRCLAPDRPTTGNERNLAANAYEILSLRFLAIGKRDVLLRSTAEVGAFWEWARMLYQNPLRKYVTEDQPKLAALPVVGRFYETPTLKGFLTFACPTLAMLFGVGIAYQSRGRSLGIAPEPPHVAAFTEETLA